MKLLFAPAIALMNRMGYKNKFALMLAISLVAISVVVYNLFASFNQVIRASQQELEGIALIKPISKFVQLAQQHRGICGKNARTVRREGRVEALLFYPCRTIIKPRKVGQYPKHSFVRYAELY